MANNSSEEKVFISFDPKTIPQKEEIKNSKYYEQDEFLSNNFCPDENNQKMDIENQDYDEHLIGIKKEKQDYDLNLIGVKKENQDYSPEDFNKERENKTQIKAMKTEKKREKRKTNDLEPYSNDSDIHKESDENMSGYYNYPSLTYLDDTKVKKDKRIGETQDYSEYEFEEPEESTLRESKNTNLTKSSKSSLTNISNSSNLKKSNNKLSIIDTNDRNWNEEFQQLYGDYKKLVSTLYTDLDPNNSELQNLSFITPSFKKDRLEDRFFLSKKLSNLFSDFSQISENTVKTIVKELKLPLDQKTIPPITSSVGGIAGGDKYSHKNIFFKFATDVEIEGGSKKTLYGNLESALKTANHEMKGLVCLERICLRIRANVHFQLMCTVEWGGHRVSCSAALPLNKSTLVYGSCDGGIKIHHKDHEVNEIMKNIGEILFSEPHLIKNENFLHYGPCDIECHRGLDGRIYIIDTARLFCPEDPNEAQERKQGAIFYRLLRPEFFQRYQIPLSSDCFSNFGKRNSNIHNPKATKATQVLYFEYIPLFSKYLDELFLNFPRIDLLKKDFDLKGEIHRYGLNLRHLSLIEQNSNNQNSKNILNIEMFCRVLKRLLRAQWRKYNSILDKDYIEIGQNYISKLLSENQQVILNKFPELFDSFKSFPEVSQFYLSFQKEIAERFFELTSLNIDPTYSFNSDLNKKKRTRCQKCSCAQFLNSVNQVNLEEKGNTNECSKCFHSSSDHKENFEPNLAIIKHTPLIFYEEAICTHHRGDHSKDRIDASEFYKNAETFYRLTVENEPYSSNSLYNWGKCLKHRAETAQMKRNIELEISCLHLALRRYESALVASRNDLRFAASIHLNTANTQLSLGKAYLSLSRKNFLSANHYFLLGKSNYIEALALKPDDPTVSEYFFNFLNEAVKLKTLEKEDLNSFISQMKILIKDHKAFIDNWTVDFNEQNSCVEYVNLKTSEHIFTDPREISYNRPKDHSAMNFIPKDHSAQNRPKDHSAQNINFRPKDLCAQNINFRPKDHSAKNFRRAINFRPKDHGRAQSVRPNITSRNETFLSSDIVNDSPPVKDNFFHNMLKKFNPLNLPKNHPSDNPPFNLKHEEKAESKNNFKILDQNSNRKQQYNPTTKPKDHPALQQVINSPMNHPPHQIFPIDHPPQQIFPIDHPPQQISPITYPLQQTFNSPMNYQPQNESKICSAVDPMNSFQSFYDAVPLPRDHAVHNKFDSGIKQASNLVLLRNCAIEEIDQPTLKSSMHKEEFTYYDENSQIISNLGSFETSFPKDFEVSQAMSFKDDIVKEKGAFSFSDFFRKFFW